MIVYFKKIGYLFVYLKTVYLSHILLLCKLQYLGITLLLVMIRVSVQYVCLLTL